MFRLGRPSITPLAGLGIRYLPGGKLGLVGALDPIISFQLSDERPTGLFFLPFSFQRLYLSVADPDALLTDLGSVGVKVGEY